MMKRRNFVVGAGAGAFALATPGRVLAQAARGRSVFTLGVASGDPLPSGVVLWTRLAPDPLAADGLGGMPGHPVPVRWEVADDPRCRRVVRRGTAIARPESAHTVHVEVEGLQPGREYFYRFTALGQESPTARTKTAPHPTQRVDELRLAHASCQSWVGGRYAAYRAMAQDDLDLVVHVGDYTYEAAATETLADFRVIHARYKTSPDLQAAHAAFPFVTTFDDHEVENNWAGDVSQPDGEASNATFPAIRAAAFQAYYEHLPLRATARPRGAAMTAFRRLQFGDLLALHVLDTRQYRDDQLTEAFPGGPRDPRVDDPARTLMGREQEAWLHDGLTRSPARWNGIAQQTIMAPYDYDTGPGVAVNHDQWDGYAAERDRLLAVLEQRRPGGPVVLSGDWHCNLVSDLPRTPGAAPVATEFTGTSISSNCSWAPQVAAALPANPHVRFFDGDRRGYVRSTIRRDDWRADLQVVAAAADTAQPATTLRSFAVDRLRPGAQPA